MNYGLIALKLGHSFSKAVHNMLFDYKYDLLELNPAQVDAFMQKKEFKAINVTIPYKETVIPYLDYMSDTAKAIGAVNTVVNRGGKLYGYNTDFYGMLLSLQKADVQIKDKKVLILGSGGTSKTALAVVRHLGCAEVNIVSRSGGKYLTYKQAYAKNDTQVIINTTPCGMFPNVDESPINIDEFPKLEVVVDAIYNPLCSKLLYTAKKRGIKAIGGLYMLVAQGAHAAQIFVGQDVNEEKIDKVYNAILSQKQNIVLVGMPSSGKSSVGKILAKKLCRTFIDTDEEIEKVQQHSISDIISSMGEKHFRDIEAETIKRLAVTQGAVIATGGGAVLRQENICSLSLNGRLFFLDRDPELLLCTPDRPLSSNKDTLMELYNKRYSIYCSCCDEKIDCNSTPTAAAQAIERML